MIRSVAWGFAMASPYQDSAIAKVAAANPGYVGVGPKPEMKDCPNDGAHMSPSGNTQAAIDLGTYYAARP